MIEKLNTNDTRPEVIIEKINELIDAINELPNNDAQKKAAIPDEQEI